MFSLAQVIAVCVISFLGGILALTVLVVCLIEMRGIRITWYSPNGKQPGFFITKRKENKVNDLIKRSDAEELLEMAIEDSWEVDYAKNRLKELPSNQPERKTGHWIDTDNYYQRWKCSSCGCHTRDAYPDYCSWCGSYNGGEQDEIDN